MQERHTNRQKYFDEQGMVTKNYVVPFIAEVIDINANINVLEIGCGEGGNLMPFLEAGCTVRGVDITPSKIENANNFYANHAKKDNLELILEDIYNIDDGKQFDIIFMRDVLEHIFDQERFLKYVKKFLKPNGKFFLGFPPWQNPFGGHQQMCSNKLLSILPYYHLLPKPLYLGILKLFNEHESVVKELGYIKDTRISLDRFERIIEREGYTIDKRKHFFINPNYEIKFGFKPREQTKIISSIPVLRNFFITTGYYVISR